MVSCSCADYTDDGRAGYGLLSREEGKNAMNGETAAAASPIK